ncbi:hypothetical protein GGR57DRAFT_313210 [Xylariaceae sp. FL1272]|nr:hypothetical protein GGR57DRAFT_313210 [Xylariaceae sp. FL1272]
MARPFRPNTQTRRGNRSGYVEHDDFEGLPVRQWRSEWVSIAPPPPPDVSRKNDVWGIELPHGMPKDSNLLPTHTQELLRAARSGRLYKRPAPAEEEEPEVDALQAEKNDKKEEDPSTKGFQIKVWKQIARNAEGSTVSYLAKRRKGIVTLSSDLPAGAPAGPTVTKATVRRVDAAGNPYTQEITLNEGQPVDGEIISTTVVAAPVPKLTGDVSASATPVRKRPPPPKRKPKGPGRGRRKKMIPTLPLNPNAGAAGTVQRVKTEGVQVAQPGHDESKSQDVEMADNDEGDDGDEGEDDDEEGDEDEDGDGADGETGSMSRADSEIQSDQMDITPSLDPVEPSNFAQQTPPEELSPLATPSLAPPEIPPSHLEGSPLKNVTSALSPVGALSPVPPADIPTQSIDTRSADPAVDLSAPVSELARPKVEPVPVDSPMQNTIESVQEDVKPPVDADVEMADIDEGTPAIVPETAVPTEPIDDGAAAQAEAQEVPAPEVVETIEEPATNLPPPVGTVEEVQSVVVTEPVVESLKAEARKTSPAVESIVKEVVAPTVAKEPPSASSIELAPEPVISTEDTETAKEPSPERIVKAPALEETPIPLPSLTEIREEQVAPPSQEDLAANSPDLFSGLEAALNQEGPASNEPPPPAPEAPAEIPEAKTEVHPPAE